MVLLGKHALILFAYSRFWLKYLEFFQAEIQVTISDLNTSFFNI